MRTVRFLSLLSATLFASAGGSSASAHDHPKPPPVICDTPTPKPMPKPMPVPMPLPIPVPQPVPPPIIRDHRDPPVIRDHRNPTGPIIRDHRKPTVIIRDHRTPAGNKVPGTSSTTPVYRPPVYVPTRRPVDASQASGGVIVTESPRRPISRKPTRKPGGGNSIDLPGPLPNIPLPKLPIGFPNPF